MEPISDNLTIKVCVRVRPLNSDENGRGCSRSLLVDCETNAVTDNSDKQLVFDAVFSEISTQAEIYEKSSKRQINQVFEGYNASIIAYGQTGSGKTFTMGNCDSDWTDSESLGIIPRAVEDIFEKARIESSSTKFIAIYMSYLEIYNEDVRDLLQDDGHGGPKSLAIRENKEEEVFVSGLSKYKVESSQQVQSLLARGSNCRATASTNMNKHSSRSHAICSFYVYVKSLDSSEPAAKDCENSSSLSNIIFETGHGIGICSSFSDSTTRRLMGATISKFHLVDLAGSERAKKSGAEGQTFKEGVNINLGLLALGNVISVLSECQQSHSSEPAYVPYRDSKLTRLLQDSLGGNARTVMITCVSPSDYNSEETCNSLRYSARARNIKNNAVVNRMKGNSAKQMEMELVSLRQEVKLLQIKLAHTQMMSNTSSSSGQLISNVRTPIDKLMAIIKSQIKMTQHYKSQSSNWQKWGENCQQLLSSDALKPCIGSEGVLMEILDMLEEFSQLQKSSEAAIMMNVSEEAIQDNLEEEADADAFLLCENGDRCDEFSDSGASGRLSQASSSMSSDFGDTSILRELDMISSEIEDKELEASKQDEEAKRLMNGMNQTVDRLQSEVQLLQAEKESLMRKLTEKKQTMQEAVQVSTRGKRNNREQDLDSVSCERTQERLLFLESKIKELSSAQRSERDSSIRARAKAEEDAAKLRREVEEAKEKRALLQKKLHEDAMRREEEKQVQIRNNQSHTRQVSKLQGDISKMKESYQKQEHVLKRQLEAAVSANKQLKVKQGLINKTAIERAKRGIELTSSLCNPANAGTILAMKRNSEIHAWLEKEIEVACAATSANKVIEKLKADKDIQNSKCTEIRVKLGQLDNDNNGQEKRAMLESLDQTEEEISRIVDSIACMQSQLVELQDQSTIGKRGLDSTGFTEVQQSYQLQMAARWKNVKSMAESRGVMSWMFDKIVDSQESDRKLVEVQVERDMMKERIKTMSKELNKLKSVQSIAQTVVREDEEAKSVAVKASNRKAFVKASSNVEGMRDFDSVLAKIELISSLPALQSTSNANEEPQIVSMQPDDSKEELNDYNDSSDEEASEEDDCSSDSDYDPNESAYQHNRSKRRLRSKKRSSDSSDVKKPRKKARDEQRDEDPKASTRNSDGSMSLCQSIQLSCQDDDEPVLEEEDSPRPIDSTSQFQSSAQLNSIWDEEVEPFVPNKIKLEHAIENLENKADLTFSSKSASSLARYLQPTKSSALKNSKKI